MSDGRSSARWPAIDFGRSRLVLGPKTWAGGLVAAVVVALGVIVTPENGWTGVGIGVAGVLGAVLGGLFQTTPKERDFTREGASAVRGLLTIADDLQNAQLLTTQLAQVVNPVDDRVTVGLINVQDRLRDIRLSVSVSMAEWNAVAPGSVDEVGRLREEGQKAFEVLVRKESHEQSE